ncbi:hypothetical protein BDR26DRAFT_853721 [Obelidium mucronatum]|nr:hypothetical protein BDR26DRAFT_853721 [Obelidium mucronatum]
MAPNATTSRSNQDSAITAALARIEAQLQTEQNQMQFIRRDIEEMGRSVRTRLEAIESKLDHNKLQLDTLQSNQTSLQKSISDLSLRNENLRDMLEYKIDAIPRGGIKQESGVYDDQRMTPDPQSQQTLTVDLAEVTNNQAIIQTKLLDIYTEGQALFQYVQLEFAGTKLEIQKLQDEFEKHTQVRGARETREFDEGRRTSRSKKRSASPDTTIVLDASEEEDAAPKSIVKEKKPASKKIKKAHITVDESPASLETPLPSRPSSRPPLHTIENLNPGIQKMFDSLVYADNNRATSEGELPIEARRESTKSKQTSTSSKLSNSNDFPTGKSLMRFSGWRYELQYGDYLEAYYKKEGDWFLARTLYYIVSGSSNVRLMVHYVGYGKVSQDCFEISSESGSDLIRPYNPETQNKLGPIGRSVTPERFFDINSKKPFMVTPRCVREGNQFILKCT